MSCTRVTRPLQNHARSQWIPSLCGFQSWQLCSVLSGQVKYCARGDSCKVALSVYSPEKHTKKVSVCESFQGGLAPLLSVDNVRREEMGGEGAGGQTGKDPPLLRMVPWGPVLCTQTCVLDSRGPFQQGTWNSLAKSCSFDSLPKHN